MAEIRIGTSDKLVNAIVNALQKAQREHADAALASPQEHTAYEYGRVSGIYAGLGLAWQIVTKAIGEDEDADDKL